MESKLCSLFMENPVLLLDDCIFHIMKWINAVSVCILGIVTFCLRKYTIIARFTLSVMKLVPGNIIRGMLHISTQREGCPEWWQGPLLIVRLHCY